MSTQICLNPHCIVISATNSSTNSQTHRQTYLVLQLLSLPKQLSNKMANHPQNYLNTLRKRFLCPKEYELQEPKRRIEPKQTDNTPPPQEKWSKEK